MSDQQAASDEEGLVGKINNYLSDDTLQVGGE